MRPRLSLLAGLIAVLALALAPSASFARHVTPHKLTINVPKNPIDANDTLDIFGKLSAPNSANRTVVLYHRLPNQSRFTRVQRVQTDSAGLYVIHRVSGVVDTNRSWFVTAGRLRSRTVNEHVRALVTLNGPAGPYLTGPKHAVTFTGHVTPNHAGERVFLQRQFGADGNRWVTIDSGRIGRSSNYSVRHTFRVPDGSNSLRVLFRGDRRNIRSVSPELDVTVTQAQNPNLTLAPSAYSVKFGDSVTLSGTVKGAPAGQTVTLRSRTSGGKFNDVASTMTEANGNYSFTVTPARNTVYQANSGGKNSAQTFVGVRDVVTVNVSPGPYTVGGTATFTGSVSPSKVGHVVELQKLDKDGDYRTLQVSRVGAGSTYRIVHRFGSDGAKTFRIVVPGGPVNERGVSDSVSLTVSPSATQ